MKDYFISYNGKDKDWAEWIAWQLEDVGYTTIIQAWDFRPGGNFVIDMQRAAQDAKRTIMVLSENYLDAMYTQPEWAAAFAQDPTGIKKTLLPVRIQNCNLTGILSQIVYIDLVGKSKNEAREMLLAGVQTGRIKPSVAPNFPEVSNLPSQLELPKSAIRFETTWEDLLYYEPETIIIPAGPFLMGNDEGQIFEAPQHKFELPVYRIGKYPVTNRQYVEFIRQTGRVVDSGLLWDGNLPPSNKLDHPVTGITWYEAEAYCKWLSKNTGRNYSLPSEAQWEKAARTTDGRLYPWGNEWQPNRCNTSIELTAVDEFPAQNKYGLFDMVGNAREWTTTLWGDSRTLPDQQFSGKWQNDGRDNPNAPKTTRRVFRGGRYENILEYRCSFRGAYLPDKSGPKRDRHGFRVVLLIN